MDPKRDLIIFCITVLLVSVGECDGQEYQWDKCYCWDEMDETLTNGLKKITPIPTLGEYEYVGAKPRLQPDTTFLPCICSDVTRFRGSFQMVEDGGNSTTSGGNDFNITAIEKNITDSIDSVLHVDEITNQFISVNATFGGFESAEETTPRTSNWNFDVVVKGRKTTELELTQFMNLNMAEVGSNFNFTILKCSGEPPVATLLVIRNWEPTEIFPGDKATYSCPRDYVLVNDTNAFSVCSHKDITWSTPESKPTCEKGCQNDPPSSPYFAYRHWDSQSRSDGSIANYSCIDGFRSVDGKNASSTCANSVWTDIDVEFKCERILCPMTIPQVPLFGKSNWDKMTVYIGTVIRYSCLADYRPTVKGEVTSTCDSNGNWTPLPSNFDCATGVELADEDGPEREKVDPSVARFFYITIPSILVRVLQVLQRITDASVQRL